ncbi:MAG TPA: AAA family ATPase, partial [Chthonomonadaceae bacterium]|nr:AAA family ATPase [Chthonomonadaceae bacterium]
RIRDCHGDLRTQNICLDARYDDGIQVFDCIEFNDAFCYIDVAADIAYLAMDLDLAGRADLRECLLNTYARATNDASLAQILPFYRIYRAIVRGNIALLAGGESEIPEPERQEQRDLAAAAYDLACCYARRRPRPALLITVGFSGSGKSVVAGEVARRLPAFLLSSDAVRKARAGMAADTPLEIEQYTPARRAEVYAALLERAGAILQRGEHVLLDATFLDPQQREAASRLARSHEAEFWVLGCRCPDSLIRQRLRARRSAPGVSDADLRVYEQQRRTYADLEALSLPASTPGHLVLLDTSLPAAETAHTVVERFLAG